MYCLRPAISYDVKFHSYLLIVVFDCDGTAKIFNSMHAIFRFFSTLPKDSICMMPKVNLT